MRQQQTPMRQYREAVGKSISEIADEIGIDRSTYHKAETGDTIPRRDKLTRILGYYKRKKAGVCLEEIIFPFGLNEKSK